MLHNHNWLLPFLLLITSPGNAHASRAVHKAAAQHLQPNDLPYPRRPDFDWQCHLRGLPYQTNKGYIFADGKSPIKCAGPTSWSMSCVPEAPANDRSNLETGFRCEDEEFCVTITVDDGEWEKPHVVDPQTRSFAQARRTEVRCITVKRYDLDKLPGGTKYAHESAFDYPPRNATMMYARIDALGNTTDAAYELQFYWGSTQGAKEYPSLLGEKRMQIPNYGTAHSLELSYALDPNVYKVGSFKAGVYWQNAHAEPVRIATNWGFA